MLFAPTVRVEPSLKAAVKAETFDFKFELAVYVEVLDDGTLVATAREVTAPKRLGAYDVLVTDGQGEVIARFNGMVYRKNEQLEAGGR